MSCGVKSSPCLESLGNATDSFILIIWVEELVWQALLSSLEFSAILFDVVSMEGEQFSQVSECKKIPQKVEIIIDSQPV